VAARIELAHDNGGFTMLPPEIFEAGGRTFYRVGIIVNEQTFYGTSEVKWNAKPGTADASAPMECAETSALGRALGMAGIGLLDSIASADEVDRSHAQPTNVHPQPPTKAVDDDSPFIERPRSSARLSGKQRAEAIGLDWDAVKRQALNVKALPERELTVDEQATVLVHLESLEKQHRKAASSLRTTSAIPTEVRA